MVQRAKLLSHDVNPAPHRIAVQLHALAGVDFRLTVQRQMLGELSHHYAGQQSRTGVTALDGFWWLRSLNYTVAPAAGQFWANRLDYPERGVVVSSCSEMLSPSGFSLPLQTGAFGFCRGDNLPVTGMLPEVLCGRESLMFSALSLRPLR